MGASCPNCQTPLPAQVTSSASSQVARCTGCGSLVLWANGRVVRATRPTEPPPGKSGPARAAPSLDQDKPTTVDPERLKPLKASLPSAEPPPEAMPRLQELASVRRATAEEVRSATPPGGRAALRGRDAPARPGLDDNEPTMVRDPAVVRDDSGPTMVRDPAAPRDESGPTVVRDPSEPGWAAPVGRPKSSPKIPAVAGRERSGSSPVSREKSAPRMPAVAREKSAPRVPALPAREKSAPNVPAASAREKSAPKIPTLAPRETSGPGSPREKSAPKMPVPAAADRSAPAARSGPTMGAAPSRGRPLTVPPRPGATGDAPRARTSTPPPIPGAAPPGPPASDPAAGWLSALAASTPPTPTPEGTAPALSALAAAAAGPANGATTAGGSQPPPASGDSSKSAALFGERALDAAAPPEVVPLVPVRKPRLLWIGGGAGALLVLILGIALALHRSGPPAAPALEVAAPPPAEKAAPAPVIAAPAPPPAAARTPPPRPAPPPKAAEVVARPAPEDPGDDNQPLVDGAQAGAHHHHHHSSKVVLDYDAASGPKPASQNPLPDGADDAVAKARSLYRRGTEKLFAGDNSGAVRDYQAALAAYPDYIGGYRGLGVGWERLGNAPRAIAAFNIYLRTVPGARDAPQIRQRIERLEKKR